MDSGSLIVEFNILHSECCNLVYARGQLVYARRRGTVRGHYYRFGQSGIFDYVSTSPGANAVRVPTGFRLEDRFDLGTALRICWGRPDLVRAETSYS